MKRILLVDDESEEFVFINYLLKDRYGDAFTLGHARTVDAARDYLSRNGVDVILLDDKLGAGLTAADTIPQLRKSAFNVPVIVISKNVQSPHLRDIARLRSNRVIDKFDFRKALSDGLLDAPLSI